MKVNSKEILEALDAAYEKHMKNIDQENAEFIRNADISIFIQVDRDYDRYSVADYIEATLDEIMAIQDMTIFID